jgi:hypothetical protein
MEWNQLAISLVQLPKENSSIFSWTCQLDVNLLLDGAEFGVCVEKIEESRNGINWSSLEPYQPYPYSVT